MGSFTLAALTGAFMRFGMYLGLPWGLQLGDVRHAHSHLMFFSWATPALALAAHAALRQSGRRLPGGAAVAGAAALAGLLAYVPFLLSGYRLLPLGDAELPLSMMASGLNGVVWYALAGLWLAGSWRARRTVAMRLMDGAVAMLLASTFGVLLLMVEGIGGTATPAGVAANADFFLTLFADGWFGLAILGLAALHVSGGRLAGRPVGGFAWLLGGAMVLRAVGRYAEDALALGWGAGVETAGAAVAALAWLALVYLLWPVAREDGEAVGAVAPAGATLLLRQLSLGLLLVKGVVELVGVHPLLGAQMTLPPVRVLFLHAFLLGAVSFGLIAAVRHALGEGAFRFAGAFVIAVFLMVAALLPLTPWWPRPLAGPWMLQAAAYTSLGPVLVALASLLTLDLGSARRATPRSARAVHR